MMVCWENIWLLHHKSQNQKIIVEIYACPNRCFLGNYLSKRQAGWVLAKSLKLCLADAKDLLKYNIILINLYCVKDNKNVLFVNQS